MSLDTPLNDSFDGFSYSRSDRFLFREQVKTSGQTFLVNESSEFF